MVTYLILGFASLNAAMSVGVYAMGIRAQIKAEKEKASKAFAEYVDEQTGEVRFTEEMRDAG